MKKYIIKILICGLILFFSLSFPVNKYEVTVFSYLKKVNDILSSKDSKVDNDIYETVVVKPRGVTRVIHLIYTLILNGEIKERDKLTYLDNPTNDLDYINVYFSEEYLPYRESSVGFISNASSLYTIPIYNAYKNKDKAANINYEGFVLVTNDRFLDNDYYPSFARYNKINNININNKSDFDEFLNSLNSKEKALLTTISDEKIEATIHEDKESYHFSFSPLFIYTIDKDKFNIKNSLFYSGTSGQLMQAISLYLEAYELSLKEGVRIAGTGTLNFDGDVIRIFSINQKIKAAAKKGINYFFLPEDNYDEAKDYIVNNNLDITLIPISKFDEAIAQITNQFIAY